MCLKKRYLPKKKKEKKPEARDVSWHERFPIQGSHELILVSPIMYSNPPFKYTINIFSGCLHPMFYQIFVSIFVLFWGPIGVKEILYS